MGDDIVVSAPEGGYGAKALTYCNPVHWFPYGVLAGGNTDCAWPYAGFMFEYSQIAYADITPYNCTEVDIYNHGPYTGSFISSETVCSGDACCSAFNGAPNIAKEWIGLQQKWDVRFTKYGCTWLTEEMYCAIILFTTTWCIEYFTGGDTRYAAYPCTNTYTHFFASCQAFKVLGAKVFLESLFIEPKMYIDAINAEEANTVFAVFYAMDHVCRPLS